MASPFYIPMRDMFNEGIQARQAAQQQFASQLAQLYAGGDMRAGQALAGMAPEQATQIRTAMEAMPGTEFSKVKQRADLLKKWHYAIQNEQDETTRALMYNQMLAQVQAAGGDISGLAPQYSKEAMTRQMNELMTFDELAGMQKERRLADSGGGAGTEWERTVAELAGGDPQDPVWRQKYLKVFMTPKLVPNQVTGGVDEQYLPADPVISRKALSVGLGINAPSRAVLNAGPGEITVPDGQPGGAPSPATQASAPQPAVPTTVVRGEPPEMSRAERERLAAEERAEQRRREQEERQAAKDREAGTQFSADQQKAAGFAARMDQAAGILAKDKAYVPPLKDITAYKFDPTGVTVSDQYKVYRQAQENWVTANLRRESGAVIGVDEMDQEIKKYFPMPGDSQAVLNQKAESRRVAEAAMKQSAGGAYKELSEEVSKAKPAAIQHPADIQDILKKYRK